MTDEVKIMTVTLNEEVTRLLQEMYTRNPFDIEAYVNELIRDDILL